MADIIAYHFTGDTLRDGRPIPPIGETLTHDGPLKLCVSGLHASIHPFDALFYAPGPLLHRVRMSGAIVHGDDKLVSSERTILASIDATDLLREFACWCAIDVIHLWDAPDIVTQYLKTRNESLREAAALAAREAALETAVETAVEAAWAAREAAWEARAAAWDVAWDAAMAAREARAAAWEVAWDAAMESQCAKFAEMVAAALLEVESE